jgi:hypothetical protein
VALAVGAPAASAAVTMSSPQEGQTVGSSFQFAGTAGVDPSVNDPSVNVHVTASNGSVNQSAQVQSDGSWSVAGDLADGSYTAQACQTRTDGGSPDCSPEVHFTVTDSSGGGGTGVTVTLPASATIKDFFAGKINPKITCQTDCDYDGSLDITPADSRRIGCLTCTDGATLGDFHGSAKAGVTELLQYGLLDQTVIAVKNVYSFPIARSVHATLTLHVSPAHGAEQTVTKPIAFKWPKQASDRHGRGEKGLITRISGPRKVKLSRKIAKFKIKFSPHFKHTRKDAYFVTVDVFTPGGHFSRGGVVFLTLGYNRVIPIVIKGKGSGTARKLAPLPAQLVIRLAPKYGHGPQDRSFYRFTLVK